MPPVDICSFFQQNRRMGTTCIPGSFFANKSRRAIMKFKRLGTVLVLAMAIACLASFSCVTNRNANDGNDDGKTPNFVKDPSAGSFKFEEIKSGGIVTGIRFISYVKNIGGTGKIGMTIGAAGQSTTKEFNVQAATSYIFKASVPAKASSTKSFTYSVKFPGAPGCTDSQTMAGYDCTGAPFDLQLN
jgi:hypothetical protein